LGKKKKKRDNHLAAPVGSARSKRFFTSSERTGEENFPMKKVPFDEGEILRQKK
jgi:hypothetical protein